MFHTAVRLKLAFIPDGCISSNFINVIVHPQCCMKFFPTLAIEGNK